MLSAFPSSLTCDSFPHTPFDYLFLAAKTARSQAKKPFAGRGMTKLFVIDERSGNGSLIVLGSGTVEGRLLLTATEGKSTYRIECKRSARTALC